MLPILNSVFLRLTTSVSNCSPDSKDTLERWDVIQRLVRYLLAPTLLTKCVKRIDTGFSSWIRIYSCRPDHIQEFEVTNYQITGRTVHFLMDIYVWFTDRVLSELCSGKAMSIFNYTHRSSRTVPEVRKGITAIRVSSYLLPTVVI